MDVRIDPEFESLITALSDEEKDQLEENIRRDGCLHPLVTWNGCIVDGHHRHEICTRLGLPFQTMEKAFGDRDEAKIWIILNQFGRRNLTPFARGELVLKLKPLMAARAAERQRAGRPADLCPNWDRGPDTPGATLEKLAEKAQVGRGSLNRMEWIGKLGSEEAKERLRRGESSVYAEYEAIKHMKPQRADKGEKKRKPSQANPRTRRTPESLTRNGAAIGHGQADAYRPPGHFVTIAPGMDIDRMAAAICSMFTREEVSQISAELARLADMLTADQVGVR